MREGVALATLLVFCVTPAVAQNTSESQSPGPATAVEMLEICTDLAVNGSDARTAAEKWGWNLSTRGAVFVENPFLEVTDISKLVLEGGLQQAEGEFRVWSYADSVVGNCSIHVNNLGVSSGTPNSSPPVWLEIEALEDLSGWDGTIIKSEFGLYGSWQGVGERQGLLLQAQQSDVFASLDLIVLPPEGRSARVLSP